MNIKQAKSEMISLKMMLIVFVSLNQTFASEYFEKLENSNSDHIFPSFVYYEHVIPEESVTDSINSKSLGECKKSCLLKTNCKTVSMAKEIDQSVSCNISDKHVLNMSLIQMKGSFTFGRGKLDDGVFLGHSGIFLAKFSDLRGTNFETSVKKCKENLRGKIVMPKTKLQFQDLIDFLNQISTNSSDKRFQTGKPGNFHIYINSVQGNSIYWNDGTVTMKSDFYLGVNWKLNQTAKTDSVEYYLDFLGENPKIISYGSEASFYDYICQVDPIDK